VLNVTKSGRWNPQNEENQGNARPSIEEQKTLHEESGLVINNLMSREVEVGARG
jgi:hypothetical protein